jgi:hypothetical protein
MGGTRSACGMMRKGNKIWLRKPEGKIPLGKSRLDGRIILKWKEVGFEDVDWLIKGSSEHSNEPLGRWEISWLAEWLLAYEGLCLMELVCSGVLYQVKVNYPCALTEHLTMKVYWGSGDIAAHILDLGTRWTTWSASHPGHFTPRESAPGTHWIGGWDFSFLPQK